MLLNWMIVWTLLGLFAGIAPERLFGTPSGLQRFAGLFSYV